tara:strand:- start:200 stop:895 length:696 start_codon:yes stop_codon:yes gene_type:complete
MAEEFEGLTVAELKVLLKERSLPVSGKKSELIERLVNAEEVVEESDEIEAPVAEEDIQEVTVDDDSDDDSDDDFDDESDDDWDDDWDDDEDEGHVAKQKPVLSEDMKVALALRLEQKKKTPAFKRTEWFRYKRLSRSGWRAPHGMDNKQRRNYKYRSSLVRVGHGKVAVARGLHPSGFKEVMVHNTNDLELIDPETEAARVGKTVGGRKREQIYSRADELGIRVLNRRRDV